MYGGVRDLDVEATRKLLEVRFWGAITAVKYASRVIAQDGSITLTSGMLAHRPTKATVVASAMGGAIEYLARGLAVDLAPVRVNAVCPGFVLTEILKQMPQERLHSYTQKLLVPRAASPTEAAMSYVNFMMNSYLTGQIAPIDGGGLVI
jgi:NAD(P)-dependent dehydrogenase (short-subunit alcohol dehydrogenase family)